MLVFGGKDELDDGHEQGRLCSVESCQSQARRALVHKRT